MAITIFDGIFTDVNNTIDTYISGTSANIVSYIDNYIAGLLIIFIALWGYALQQGLINEPITEGLRRIIKISLITTLALNAGTYGVVVVNFFQSLPNEIGNAVTGGNNPSAISPNILDQQLNKGISLGNTAWENASIINGIGFYLIAFIVWAITIIAVTYSACLILFSKFAVALLLALGPIYITLALFKATQRFFESWLTQLVNYATLQIITVAIAEFILNIFGDTLTNVQSNLPTEGIQIGGVVSIAISCFFVVFILRQAPSIASGISGGISLATQGAFSWAMGKLSSSASAMRPRNIAMSYDRAARYLKQDVAALQRPALAAKGLYMRVTGQNKNSISNHRPG